MSRVTVDIDDAKLVQAMKDAGTQDAQEVVQFAIDEYIAKRAKLRLAGMGGTSPDIRKAFADFPKFTGR